MCWWKVFLTSSTCACVCCSRLLLVRFGAGAGGPPSPSEAPGAPGVPAASGVDLQTTGEEGGQSDGGTTASTHFISLYRDDLLRHHVAKQRHHVNSTNGQSVYGL